MANVEFVTWLNNVLKDLNTDENVFGSYILGILDSDDTLEEKVDALEGILSEIVENEANINTIKDNIIEKWKCSQKTKAPDQIKQDVDDKLVKLLESQALTTTKQRTYTEEEKKVREAILAQYSQMTDDEEENDQEHGGSDQKSNNLEKNCNAQVVQEAEKAKREQSRLDSQKKKEKDKEDREKQKQLKEEKKEKRKTQKGERRR